MRHPILHSLAATAIGLLLPLFVAAQPTPARGPQPQRAASSLRPSASSAAGGGRWFASQLMPGAPGLRTTRQGVRIGGSLIYARSWTQMGDYEMRPYGIYAMKAQNPISMTALAVDPDYYVNGGAYAADGIYHMVTRVSYNGQTTVVYSEYDMQDWTLINQEEGDEDYVAVDLTYNPLDDTVYGIFANDQGGYTFASIMYDMGGYRNNINEDLDVKLMALAASDEGDIYGIGLDGTLYLVDSDTGELETVGPLGVTPDNYLQGAAFAPDGTLYWAAQLPGGKSALYAVSTESGEAELIAPFTDDEELTGLFVMAPEAADAAPGAPTKVQAQFADASLTGEVTFFMPSQTYGGEALSGELTYTVSDGSETLATGTALPSAAVKAQVTVAAEGMTTFEVRAANAAGQGPAAKTELWVGYDVPLAPTNVLLAVAASSRQATLTWTAPKQGQHGGFVDTQNLTYIVTRYPDEVVASGITGTTFEETLPEGELTTYYYTVAAVNGTHTSRAAQSNAAAAGEALEVPFVADLSKQADFNLFTVLDTNRDGYTWEWAYTRAWYLASPVRQANDWLVSPEVNLKTDRTYRLGVTFDCGNSAKTEQIAIAFGQGDDPKAFDTMLEPTEFNSTDKLVYDDEIRVSEPGAYRLAIHAMSEADQDVINVYEVSITEGTQFAAPDSATALQAAPAPLGALSASLTFTLPVKTFGGDALTALTKAEVLRDGELISTLTDVVPGQQLSITDDTPHNGMNRYEVIAWNEVGPGQHADISIWVGIDEPLEPQNIKIKDNGNNVTVSWEAPGSVGIHDGYVVPDDLYYNVYDMMGNLLVRNIKAFSWTDRSVKLTGQQQILYYWVSAVSKGGEGWADASESMVTGTPYTLPFVEHFTDGGLDRTPWWFDRDMRGGSFAVSYGTSHDDLNGAALFHPSAPEACGGLCSGRISLSDTQQPGLVFYYYAVPGAGARLKVSVSETTDEPLLLKTIDYSQLQGEAGWRRCYVDLSAVKEARYVVLRFRAEVPDGVTQVIFDDITVSDMMQSDLAVKLEAPAVARLGTTNDATVIVSNEGVGDAGSFDVSLSVAGLPVASAHGDGLAAGATQSFSFQFTPSVMLQGGDVTLEAAVDYAADQKPQNNSAEAHCTAQQPEHPTVTGLTATQADGDVLLSWTAPAISEGPVTDDFESYEPWLLDGIGPWKVYDGDKAITLQYSDIWVHNAGRPMAFEVFNTTDEELDVNGRRKFLRAHSGVQYLSAWNPSPAVTDQADDWLISPLLSGEAQTINYFAKSQAVNYPETYEVMYSTTDNAPESFINIQTFPDVPGGLVWQEYNIDLPAGSAAPGGLPRVARRPAAGHPRPRRHHLRRRGSPRWRAQLPGQRPLHRGRVDARPGDHPDRHQHADNRGSADAGSRRGAPAGHGPLPRQHRHRRRTAGLPVGTT